MATSRCYEAQRHKAQREEIVAGDRKNVGIKSRAGLIDKIKNKKKYMNLQLTRFYIVNIFNWSLCIFVIRISLCVCI